MRPSLVVSLLFLCFLQLGCAYQKVSLRTHKRIGVVSLISDKVETKYVGMWAFSNKGAETSLAAGALSRNTREATESALRANGFDVVPGNQDHPELAARYTKRARSLGSFFADNLVGDSARASVGPELKQMVARNRLDALVVVVPNRPTGGGEATVGVGNYGFGTISGEKGQVSVYAMTNLLFLDGPTLRTLTFRYASKMQPQPGIPFMEDFSAYSPEQQHTLLEAMRQAFRERVGPVVQSVVRR